MSTFAGRFVLINGELLAASQARISVFDRGLLYGDGLFETLRAYNGRPFALNEHLARLRASAAFLDIRLPRQSWRQDIGTLLRRNRLVQTDAWVRITLTRGVAAPRLVPPARMQPTIILTTASIDPGIASAQRRGVRVVLLPFARDGFLAEHKVIGYLPAVLGKSIAARRKAFEGLFVDGEGMLSEGTTSNIFIVRDASLLTPPVKSLLPGVTRRLIIAAAATDGLRVVEQPLRTVDLLQADEAFLTSAVAEVVPITAVDTHAVGTGRVGPRTRCLQRAYRQLVAQALPAAE
ncbi:MAG: branched chain amino acid aminotransferase apoenzyme [Deltaproteobacteria bacterium]|jgi:D-amino acid aminotransferase|nr:branched chain amino acid aminotransferase apoenzyme [Deltaproteobacteria bacterium]